MSNISFKNIFRAAQIVVAAATVLVCAPEMRAQQEAPRFENRVLLVYDTSWAMKSRIPKTQQATAQLLSRLATVGELRSGDTIGVWTFSQDVTTGKMPLQFWNAAFAVPMISNIVQFVEKQKYSGSTQFEKLMPSLQNVVQDSDRLTVVIFCDGDGKISSTHWDAAVNDLFAQRHTVARSAGEPIVVVFRAQLGRYVGCGGSVAPQLDVPYFPPFPAPPKPLFTPPKTNVPPPTARVEEPLVIIGTNVYTGARALTNLQPPQPRVVKANPPAESIVITAPTATNVITVTNVVIVTNNFSETIPTDAPQVSVVTNAPATLTNTEAASTIPAQTNSVAAATEDSGDSKIFSIVGGIFLIAAVGVALFLFGRSKKPDSASLITRSMNKK